MAQDYDQPEACHQVASKGRYLVFAISLQNNGTKSVNVSSILSWTFRDGAGQSYNETIVGNAPTAPNGEIAVGDKLAGSMVYDVPKGQDFKLYFKNDIFSSGSVVVDLGTH